MVDNLRLGILCEIELPTPMRRHLNVDELALLVFQIWYSALSNFRKPWVKFHEPAALGAFIPCIERVCGRKPLSWMQVETDRDKVGRSMITQLGARLVRAGSAPKYG